MKKTSNLWWTGAAALAAVLAVAVYVTLLPAPVEASGCGPCTGDLRSVSGHGGPDADANRAYNQAYQDAYAKASVGAPACVPCQLSVSNVVWGVSTPSCSGPSCPGPVYVVNLTLNYRCQACTIEGPD